MTKYSNKKITIYPADAVCRVIARVEFGTHVVSEGFDSYAEAAAWAINYELPTHRAVRGENNEWSAD